MSTLSRTVILSQLLFNYVTQDYTASVPLKHQKAFVFFFFTEMVMCKKTRLYAEASVATPFYVIM